MAGAGCPVGAASIARRPSDDLRCRLYLRATQVYTKLDGSDLDDFLLSVVIFHSVLCREMGLA